MQEAIFIPNKRKYLFCADQLGISILFPIIEEVINNNVSYEMVYIGEIDEQESSISSVQQWLIQQKMGSYLYFAGTWDHLRQVKQLADDIGYSDEETQFIGCGQRSIRVFCCRCHGINEVEDESEITCCRCSIVLNVTDHYSRLHDAFLGYVAKL